MSDSHRHELSIEFVPAIEFVTSIDSAGPRPALQRVLDTNNGGNPWRKEVEAVVSAFELADLDLLFSPVSTSLFLFHLIIKEGNSDAENLIDSLQGMDEKEFLDRFRLFLRIEEDEADWIETKVIEEALENDRARENQPFDEEAGFLVDLLSSADMFRRKLVEVLTWYNQKIFSQGLAMRRDKVEGWIKRNRESIEKNLQDTLDRLTQDSYESLISSSDRIRIFPISGSANSEVWLMLPDETYLVFTLPYAEERVGSKAENQERDILTDRAVEALADPKRIAMLRALRGRPYFSKELADLLGISAPTVSYHIEKLVNARLVKLEVSSGRRFYYAINQRGFADLLRNLEREFIPEGVGE